MDRFQSMKVFLKVAELGGFAEAARQLGMSPPAVTRAIGGLEKVIGAPLLARTTRTVKLTEAGGRYFEDCRRILLEVAEAEAGAGGAHAKPAGLLTVTAPVLFGAIHVQPIVVRYLRAHDGVTAHAVFVDRNVNLIEEGIDVAVRLGELSDSGMHAVGVGGVRRMLCASPEYLKKHGEPRHPSDLSSHQVILASGASSSPEWRFGRNQKTVVALKPRLNCNLNEAAISSALAGFGITRVLSYQIDDHLKTGKLRALLVDYETDPIPIHVVRTGGGSPSAKVRAFVDLTVDTLRRNPRFR
jgi:DNA-binding transcriptional LysR family regulator